ncbi:MAG: 23S rRNA (adenine(2503)-C(2))-methyltransferase RlmN [Gemmataceae bacterium]
MSGQPIAESTTKKTAGVTDRPGILSCDPETLAAWLVERGYPRWYAGQIRRWIVEKRATDFGVMSDLPKVLRQTLSEHWSIFSMSIGQVQQARDGTRKLLLFCADGEQIECVAIPEADRRTACISTQVGCGMGCVFCASGLLGVARNLRSHEILEQLVLLRNILPIGERLTHIVVMGMGEPLANLPALLEALEVACHPHGLGLSARHVTISTVGLPDRIRQLAQCGRPYHLAVSLHAPNDALRTRIVPTNARIGIGAIVAAADEFYRLTGRQVTYEYVLLGGINDQLEQAQQLAQLLQGRHAHVNLIPYNEVAGLPYRRPTQENLLAFVRYLRRAGISVKVRKRKGSEIDAACGQLRRRQAVGAMPSADDPRTQT